LANPPSNAPLLDWLAEGFIANKYDMKWLHKTIAMSNTYQASWRTNPTNELDIRNFSHAIPRRLPAEVAIDAIQQATAADSEIVDFQTGIAKRAIGPGLGYRNQGAAGRGNTGYALATFGKPARETNCDCERSMDPSLLQTLYLRNDREMLTMIDRRGGWLDSIARTNKLSFASAAPEMEARRRGRPVQAAETKAAETKTAEVKTAQPVALPGPLKAQLEQLKSQANKIEKQLGFAKKSKDEQRMAKIKSRQTAIEARLAKLQAEVDEFQAKNKPVAPPAATQVAKPTTDNPAVAGKNSLGSELSGQLVRQIYLRSLSRLPNEDEQARAVSHLEDAKDPVQGLRDVLWAVLNTKEFIVNH